eukprot:scaffold123860_cov36-Phaeocystis_antarctica.AAC.1
MIGVGSAAGLAGGALGALAETVAGAGVSVPAAGEVADEAARAGVTASRRRWEATAWGGRARS